MRQFIIPERDQLFLMLQGRLDSIAPIGSALRCIEELVEKLDTRKIEKDYDMESPLGQEPFHPRTLIKVALYAIHNCRFSLRKMEEDTHFHLGYKWLTGNMGIDHSTMGKFLSKNKEELSDLFEQVVEIGVSQELVDFEILAVDTVKIRANASYKQFRDKEGLEKERKKIRERIKRLIEKAGEEGSASEKEEMRILEKRKERLIKAQKELEKRVKAEYKKKNKKERINITDFDCRLVKQANGETNAGYGITTTTDSKNQFITGFQINEEINDAAMLQPAIEESEKNSGERHDVVVADSNFSFIENLEKLKEDGQEALIPDTRLEVEKQGKTAKGEYDRSRFKYDNKKDCYKCPVGKVLEKAGEVEKNGREYNWYKNKSACAGCKNRERCTKGKYRIISRDKEEWLKEEMREKLNMKKNARIYGQRAPVAESPYGQIKHNLKYRIFMRRGEAKIKMEAALMFMLHNILKIGQLNYATG